MERQDVVDQVTHRLAKRVPRGLRAWGRRNSLLEFWSWISAKKVTLPSVEQLAQALAALHVSPTDATDEGMDPEDPIFLLAGGWRTGSTLLQRILVTDPRLLLWGEPLGELAIVPGIAEILYRISGFSGLDEYYPKEHLASSAMATSWIGTLYPPGNDLHSAVRGFFDRWLGEPARERGFSRWGFKEVRLGAAEATLLHWVYPRAKFVLLSRHPYDCYRSLSDSGWHHVYYRRPDVRVDSAAGFARHWNRIALSWSQLPKGFPAFHIKYEDLIAGAVDFRKLESWLNIEVKEKTALEVFVGRTAVRPRLSWHERMIIRSQAARGMRALGYATESSGLVSAGAGARSAAGTSADEPESVARYS